MAFQAPATAERPRLSPPHAHLTAYHELEDFHFDIPSTPSLSRNIYTPAEEEEWVLFSPSLSTGRSTDATQTRGSALVSEAASFLEGPGSSGQHICANTEPSYGIFDGTDYSEVAQTYEELNEGQEGGEQEQDNESLMRGDGETDSLGVFHNQFHVNPILLPTHDGRGMFPPLSTAEENRAMLGLFSLEESLRLVGGKSDAFDQAADLNSRIQKWRTEQSNALLEELKQSKRTNRDQGDYDSSTLLGEEDEAALSMLGGDINLEELKETLDKEHESKAEPSENFLRRVTRRLMRDLMGIDDNILGIIFGEALPESEGVSETEGIKQSWERRLLERIARELGILIQHYTAHPTEGAFSTYSRWIAAKKGEDDGTKTPTPKAQEPVIVPPTDIHTSASEIDFKPTLPQSSQEEANAAFWGIEDHATSPHPATNAKAEAQRRKEYWEQELGVRVFFSYLKSRFSSSAASPSRTCKLPTSADHAEPKPIHHQHPLVQRRIRRNASSSHAGPSHSPTSWGFSSALGLGGFRTGGSCASHSTRTSKKFGDGPAVRGESRKSPGGSTMSKGYYWEVETSVGSGRSCVGTGVWGEI